MPILRCMKKRILILLFLFSFKISIPGGSQWSTGGCHNFSGTMGKQQINMSLCFFDNDSVKGNFYENCQSKISVTGKVNGNELFLSGFYDQKKYGYATIRMNGDSLNGVWHGSSNAKATDLRLHFDNGTGGTFDHRYFYGFNSLPDHTDDEIENFAQAMKTAVLSEDSNWIADHLSYPIRVGFYSRSKDNNKSKYYNSKAEVLNDYQNVANRFGINALECPHNLFWNASGVRFGNCWFGYPNNYDEGGYLDSLAILLID